MKEPEQVAGRHDTGVTSQVSLPLASGLPVLVVVPCFNEASRLPIGRFSEYLTSTEGVGFVFVNDGSKDDTLTLVTDFAAAHPGRATVVDLSTNKGKAEAVRQGMLIALTQVQRNGLVGYWDADLATPLETISRFRLLLEEREAVDCVIGARVKLLGRRIVRREVRHYLGRFFATGASVVLGIPIYDTQCGAKLFRATPLLAEVFVRPFVSRWIFDVELIGRYLNLLAKQQESVPEARFFEYPLEEWVDVKGSKVSAFAFLRGGFELVRVAFGLRAHRRGSAVGAGIGR